MKYYPKTQMKKNSINSSLFVIFLQFSWLQNNKIVEDKTTIGDDDDTGREEVNFFPMIFIIDAGPEGYLGIVGICPHFLWSDK